MCAFYYFYLKFFLIVNISGVAKGGAGGANAPPQIFVVPLLQKTLYIMHIRPPIHE